MSEFLSGIDVATIILYFLLVLFVGYFYSKKIKNMEDFVLGGRKLPLTIAVGTLMASWYCTFSFAELAFTTGIVVWVIWGAGASLAKIPMALWVGPKVQMSDSLTLPEMMKKLYDKKTAVISAALLVFYCTALYGVTGLKIIGTDVFGMDGMVFAGIVCVIVMGLSMMGGLLSVSVTDFIQMIFMIVGVAIAVFFAWPAVGGWAGIEQAVALNGTPTHLNPLGDGGPGMQLMFLFVVLSFSSYADPSFYQRFSASESPKSARKALLICICLWLAWDACVCILGLCGLALFPDLSPGGAYLNVSLSVLPVVLRGLFLCGVLGAIVSTLSSYWLIGGTCIANDIYRYAINPNASEKSLLMLNRLGIVFMGLFALLLASQFSMMASAWAFLGSMWTGGALVPVLGGLFYPGRVSKIGGFWSLVSGILATAACSGYFLDTATTIGIQPLFISLPISLIVFIVLGRFGEESKRKNEGGMIYV